MRARILHKFSRWVPVGKDSVDLIKPDIFRRLRIGVFSEDDLNDGDERHGAEEVDRRGDHRDAEVVRVKTVAK